MVGGTRAQKPVGSATWIAAEKENMVDLVEQEMEEVEYPVRHEMEWLNEHMTEIFSKGQTNFTDVFKTPGKMRGKTPRTARKRNVEDNRVPLSEIFSSTHQQGGNGVSPSPFVHRVVSKANAASASASPKPKIPDTASQPQYPDLSQNLNSFTKYNTDSGYHGMENKDEMVLPGTQPESQASTQPMEVEQQSAADPPVDHSISEQTADDSFHSAQEDVRARGGTVDPTNTDPAPVEEQTPRPAEEPVRIQEPRSNLTPTAKPQSKPKAKLAPTKQQGKPATRSESEQYDKPMANTRSSMDKLPNSKASETPEPEEQDVQMRDLAKEDTVLDTFDDIGSPSDGSTPERPLVRQRSLTFASLPAREPLTKSIGGSRISRTSHIDLPKLSNAGRPSHLGRQTGVYKSTQASLEDNMEGSDAMEVDEKTSTEDTDMDKASKLHSTKSTQSLHDRISMLGKLQPSRPKKSISATAGLSTGQIAYPDLPAGSKPETNSELLGQKDRNTPTLEPSAGDDDDWIKPLSSPQRPTLSKSKTADVMENVFSTDSDQSAMKKGTPAALDQKSADLDRPKTSHSLFSSPRPQGHQHSASASHVTEASTTPTGSPRRFDGPLSASKMKLQSIMMSAKGLLTSSSGLARKEPSSPVPTRIQSQERPSVEVDDMKARVPTPPRQETRRTRSSTEKEEKRRLREQEDRQREEARHEKAREQEKQRALQNRATQEKSSVEPEERASVPSSKQTQSQRQQSREPESMYEGSKIAAPQSKQNDRRPKPPTREVQKPKMQPVSIRVGSTLPRHMPMASSVSTSNTQEAPASVPASASKPSTLKKKGSNTSLHTASSTGSFKSSVSHQTQAQRKAQLAGEKKREQEERETRRKEEQKRDQERKRVAQQQQEESRRQGARSRAESADRERRERSAQEDPKKAAHMQAIEKRRLENARRHERQGSQQANDEGLMLQHEKPSSQSSQRNDMGVSRAPSRLGSIQPYGRPINPPAPNPAKPPKRVMDEEAGHRPAVKKPSNILPAGEAKRQRTEDDHSSMQPVRPHMAPPIRHSNIRKPSVYGQSGVAHPSSSSIFKTAQPQRPAHPVDMGKFANGKIPFAEPNHAPPPSAQKPTAPSSAQRVPPPKASPKYPSGESIHLPEIATDSEDDDDSDSEMFPVPKWAQPKELEGLLRQQDGMEVDSIFGPIAPFSLEETFKADKKIKKYRDRTSSANWSGPDGLTQDEIRKDVADRQRMRLNGGWSFN